MSSNSSDVLLAARGLAKSYPMAGDPASRLRAFGRLLIGRPYRSIGCIDDVSFDIGRGESLGIIGENGAGKSTLLKLLTGVLHPSRGTVYRRGSVGALLELGAGFDTEQSGRTNIALAAALMGWSGAQIRERSDEIIGFADIGRYIDEPVKHYSSGMVVRLGFAIIAAVRPDLLITDEVLAVGDESFQKKCIRWMEDYLETGGTLLLVSHSMYHVQKLCKHALWLKDGRVQAYGDVFDVTQDYLAFHERKSAPTSRPTAEPEYCGAEYRITRLLIDGEVPPASLMLREGQGFLLEFDIYRPDGRMPQGSFGVLRADGTPVYGTTNEIAGATGRVIDDRHVRYTVRLEQPALLPGGYTLRVHAMDPEGMRLFDTVECTLTVRGQSREFGMVRLPHHWE